MRVALNGTRKNYYMKYLCPDDRRYSHVRILPDALLSPPVPEGNFVTVDDASPITETSTLETPRQETLFILGYELIYTATDKELHAIRFTSQGCPTGADVAGLGLVAVGGDGVAAPSNLVTDDRFADVETPAGGTTAHYGKALFTDGALVVVGYADDPDATAAAAGSIAVSANGGVTLSAVPDITDPINGIDRVGETLIAVGGAGGGAAKIYYSQNEGATWVEYTGTLPAADALIAVAADDESEAAYAVGKSGNIFKITVPGTTLTVVDLSSSLAGVPDDLTKVKVLGQTTS